MLGSAVPYTLVKLSVNVMVAWAPWRNWITGPWVELVLVFVVGKAAASDDVLMPASVVIGRLFAGTLPAA